MGGWIAPARPGAFASARTALAFVPVHQLHIRFFETKPTARPLAEQRNRRKDIEVTVRQNSDF